MQKNILVPVGPHNKDLGAVQHAMALAKRIPARVFILKFEPSGHGRAPGMQKDDLLDDLVTTAWRAGLSVSYHTAGGSFGNAVMGFIEREAIHILVLGDEAARLDRFFARNRKTIPIPVIFVRQKDGKAKHIGRRGALADEGAPRRSGTPRVKRSRRREETT